MSNPGVSKLQSLSLTGNPTWDAAIRYGLVALAGILTGAITGWLNAHGFKDPNLVYYVGGAVTSVLGGVAMTTWGLLRTSKNESIAKLREAVALATGINIAENPNVVTPQVVSVAEAQKLLVEHAPATLPGK